LILGDNISIGSNNLSFTFAQFWVNVLD